MSNTVTETQHASLNVDATREEATAQLLRAAEDNHTKPLWAQMTRLNPPLPNPQCIPHVWEYKNIRPQLLQAGELITEKQAERRVMMLVNPNRDTIYGGLQLVMPNETAPAHRHTAFACRFIIEGQGGFTAVHGRRIRMQRGDVILTPTWNWHDHGKDGSGPMIWLDGLDLPNFIHFPVHFVEHYNSPRYPAEDVDSNTSPIVFPWTKMKADLDKSTQSWVCIPYLKEDGSESESWLNPVLEVDKTLTFTLVSRILGTSASKLMPGTSSPKVQETASSLMHVIEGAGYSEINGKKYMWEKGDTFCIPAWHEYQHFANDGEPVYLYRCHDMPMLKALGFYRTAEMDVETLVSE
ncbi:hypothetical protein jhhlp_005794 [Lomentospora prolificans]|uniref:Cupin type-2 domain-containing protein n=1 Tax=Lomentospora prolificans TaxID=41688 RepID=A0A2N3N451_9PEZI|nr:hypothetical protein jhhlp_005794 [Lomentospora prolificans]